LLGTLQNYSRDIMGFIFLTLTLVAFATSMHQTKAPQLLNRLQTEEWKGWMQVGLSLALRVVPHH
jgi:N-acetylneuraminate 9-O-acetyltransferase